MTIVNPLPLPVGYRYVRCKYDVVPAGTTFLPSPSSEPKKEIGHSVAHHPAVPTMAMYRRVDARDPMGRYRTTYYRLVRA